MSAYYEMAKRIDGKDWTPIGLFYFQGHDPQVVFNQIHSLRESPDANVVAMTPITTVSHAGRLHYSVSILAQGRTAHDAK